MKKNIVFVVLALLIGAAAFYGGMKYSAGGSLQANTFSQGGQSFFGQGGNQPGNTQSGQGAFRGGRLQSGNMVNGDILSADNTSITLKLRNGGSKIVFYSGSTEIMKSVSGTVSDLVAGKTVMVAGTANNDGSLTANTIQIRPPMPADEGRPTQQSTQQQ